MDSYIDRQ